MPDRRSFITGIASLIAVPAIVRAASLMPVRGIVQDIYGTSPAMAALIARAKELSEIRARMLAAWDMMAFGTGFIRQLPSGFYEHVPLQQVNSSANLSG